MSRLIVPISTKNKIVAIEFALIVLYILLVRDFTIPAFVLLFTIVILAKTDDK